LNTAIIGQGKFGQAIGSLLEYKDVIFEYAERDKLLTRPADLIFLTLPTRFIRGALRENSRFISEKTTIVNGVKGIEEKTHLLPHQIVASVGSYGAYYSLMGPSFAYGVKAKQPTIVSLGYEDPQHLNVVSNLLQTSYFRVHPVSGYAALELAGALKNLYAILCGYAYGLGLGMNTQALLITLALGEFTRLADAMGFTDYNVMAPGVVGDLMLTCSSEQSRNFKFGLHLAKADDQEVQKMLASTVEGYHTSHSIRFIARELKVELPLAFLTLKLISNKGDSATLFHDFIANC